MLSLCCITFSRVSFRVSHQNMSIKQRCQSSRILKQVRSCAHTHTHTSLQHTGCSCPDLTTLSCVFTDFELHFYHSGTAPLPTVSLSVRPAACAVQPVGAAGLYSDWLRKRGQPSVQLGGDDHTLVFLSKQK